MIVVSSLTRPYFKNNSTKFSSFMAPSLSHQENFTFPVPPSYQRRRQENTNQEIS
jgi:hypothetical protein